MRNLAPDCTGTTRAGLKLLERAGYGFSSSYPAGKLPLDEIKVSYDQRLHYSSFMFSLTPSLRDLLPIPGGIENKGALYTFLEDVHSPGRHFFLVGAADGNRCSSLRLVSCQPPLMFFPIQ